MYVNTRLCCMYSLLIVKDICDRRNVSVKFPCAYVCFWSGDLFIFSIIVCSLFSYFLKWKIRLARCKEPIKTDDWLIDWLVCCLLTGTDLWKRMSWKCSITMVFACPLLSWCKISSPFRENNNNVVVLPFPFHIFMTLVNLWFIRLQG